MIQIIQRIVQCTIGVTFLVLTIVNWRYNHIGQNIINLLGTSLFFAGFDHILIFYRCYLDQPSFQYEATFITYCVFVLGLLFETFNSSPTNKQTLNQICFYIIFVFLILNTAYFVAMVAILFAFFIRHIYRLMTNRLPSPEQVLDENMLNNLLRQQKPFQEIIQGNPSLNTACSICLLDFEKDVQCIKLPECQHVFHSECIEQWLKDRPTCPYCRNNVILSAL